MKSKPRTFGDRLGKENSDAVTLPTLRRRMMNEESRRRALGDEKGMTRLPRRLLQGLKQWLNYKSWRNEKELCRCRSERCRFRVEGGKSISM